MIPVIMIWRSLNGVDHELQIMIDAGLTAQGIDAGLTAQGGGGGRG